MTGRPVDEPRTRLPGTGVFDLGMTLPSVVSISETVPCTCVSKFETDWKNVNELPRIQPLNPPYERDVATRLEAMMPPGVPPILLFRTFAKNPSMARAMGSWGRYELSKELSLSLRDREIVIDRTCARCDCEYEWGVHIAFFADRAGLSREQVSSIASGLASDACWTEESDRLLIDAVDAMHDTGTISADLYAKLATIFNEAQILDLTMLCGWYHAISFSANVAGVQRAHEAPRFSDY